jgi:hypothetical protein
MKVILSVPDEGYSERTRWRLFHKRVVLTKFNIYVFIINFVRAIFIYDLWYVQSSVVRANS